MLLTNLFLHVVNLSILTCCYVSEFQLVRANWGKMILVFSDSSCLTDQDGSKVNGKPCNV